MMKGRTKAMSEPMVTNFACVICGGSIRGGFKFCPWCGFSPGGEEGNRELVFAWEAWTQAFVVEMANAHIANSVNGDGGEALRKMIDKFLKFVNEAKDDEE